MANFYLFPEIQFQDNAGAPLAGGLISTFAGGTSTPQATFTDSTGGTPQANPVVLDSAGRCQMWLSPLSYKFVIKTSGGSTLATIDNYNPANINSTVTALTDTGDLTMQQTTAATSGANQSSKVLRLQGNYWNGSASALDEWDIQDVLGAGTNPTSTLSLSHSGSSGTASFSPQFDFNIGSHTLTAGPANFTQVTNTGDEFLSSGKAIKWNNDAGISRLAAASLAVGNGTAGDKTGIWTARSYAGAWLMADTFTDVQTAINALPASGGVVDARSPNCNLALGTIDPGSTKQVTILFGPYNYTCDHIVLQANFRLLGTAATNVSGAGTNITSVGANSQPLIVNITSGFINVRTAQICDITFIGAAGNTTQDGMRIDTTANTTASVVDHLWLKHVNFSGFKGRSIYSKAPITNNGSFNQMWKFDHVTAVRPSGALEALRITGESGQMDFYSCVFDGAAKGNGTNIYIGTESNSDTAFPYSINFYSLTSQGANIDVQCSGFSQVGFYNSHHENSNIVYQIDALHTISRNGNIVFCGGYFANAGVNAGAGRILKVTTALAYGVILEKSTLTTTIDRLVESTNGAEVVVHDNTVPSNTAVANATTGIDFQVGPAATLNLGNYHTVMLQASATSVTTLVSQLGPGESISFFANGICSFATGGNIVLVGASSLLTLQAGETATFTNSDYSGGNTWRLTGTSTATLSGATLVQLTAQGANIGTTTAFAVPATAARAYRIMVYGAETRAATTSSTMVSVVIGWTDPDSNTAVTFTAAPGTPGGNVINNPAQTDVFLTMLIKAKLSTNITYQTTNYATSGATSMQYALSVSVEPM